MKIDAHKVEKVIIDHLRREGVPLIDAAGYVTVRTAEGPGLGPMLDISRLAGAIAMELSS